MRNLKKILALVLALVMVVGMMTVASAATAGTGYKDDASIASYDEAVQVLTALGIYRGDEKGNFNPNATITRGEVAALVYRIVHQDVNDVYAGIYADYNKFEDVKSSDWNAGYINYCANGEYILGDGAGHFLPNGKVNGYQILAIMLRALGYDKEGEFQGAGWEVRTARKAKELGITKNVTEGTLGAPATRTLVAELIFRSLLCETQSWNVLFSYAGNETTLAYEVFGLVGGYEDAETEVEAMAKRNPAAPDAKYGEPVAAWYIVDANDEVVGAIPVRFNPVATYTKGLTAGELWNLLYKVHDPLVTGYFPVDYTIVDGGDPITTGYAVYGTPDLFSGKGAVADVFSVEGKVYVIVKNTYANVVALAYNTKTKAAMELALEDGTIDYPAPAYYATHAGIAAGSLVIYNKYQDNIDFTTIHTASSKVVTLTNSYVTGSTVDSYFKAGNTKYEYDINYATTVLAPALLDREDLIETNDETQIVFFDDYGYVIYAMDVPEYGAYGYMLVTNATYGGYSNDNGYYMNIKGYDMNGKQITVKGGFGQFVYGTKTEAQDAEDYIGAIGIYYYAVDAESGLYQLTTEPVVSDASVEAVMNGDPDTLGDGALFTGETVFVVANYNKSGLITGYTVTKGFKNIKDLTNAGIESPIGAADCDWAVYALDAELNMDGEPVPNGHVDFVFVTGAKQTADTRYKTESQAEVFYLLNPVPEKQFAEYDLYNVVVGGKVTTMKVDATAGISFSDVGFYTVLAETNDYVSDVDSVDPADLEVVLADVLTYSGADVWEYAACQDGKIVLADNCKIINLTNGACTEITTADLIVDEALTTPKNALGWNWYQGIAAEYNQYGFVTVLYVVGGFGGI